MRWGAVPRHDTWCCVLRGKAVDVDPWTAESCAPYPLLNVIALRSGRWSSSRALEAKRSDGGDDDDDDDDDDDEHDDDEYQLDRQALAASASSAAAGPSSASAAPPAASSAGAASSSSAPPAASSAAASSARPSALPAAPPPAHSPPSARPAHANDAPPMHSARTAGVVTARSAPAEPAAAEPQPAKPADGNGAPPEIQANAKPDKHTENAPPAPTEPHVNILKRPNQTHNAVTPTAESENNAAAPAAPEHATATNDEPAVKKARVSDDNKTIDDIWAEMNKTTAPNKAPTATNAAAHFGLQHWLSKPSTAPKPTFKIPRLQDLEKDADQQQTTQRPKVSQEALTGLDAVLSLVRGKKSATVLDGTRQKWTEFKKDDHVREELETYKKGKHRYTDRMAFLARTDVREWQYEQRGKRRRR